MASIPSLFLTLALIAPLPLGGGWLGVRLADAERPTIAEVVPGSPAAKAQLRAGDVFLSVNKKPTKTVEALVEILADLNSGDTVLLGMARGEKRFQVKVRLGGRPADPALPGAGKAEAKKPVRPAGKPYVGVELEETDAGVEIASVVPGSPAARYGLKKGDALQAFGGKRIKTLADLDRAMAGLRARSPVQLVVQRGGQAKKLRMVLGGQPVRAARPGPNRRVVTEKPARRLPRAGKKVDNKQVAFSTNLQTTLGLAKRRQRPVFVVFGASWCVNCETLKKSLRHPSLRQALSSFECAWIDTDRQSALADKYGVESLPHMVFLDAAGKKQKTVVGYQPPEVLLPTLRSLAAKAHGKAPRGARTAKKAVRKPAKKVVRKPVKKPGDKPAKKPAKKPARQPRRANRTGTEFGRAMQELARLRRELQQLRREQREQRALLQKILAALKDK